MRRAAIFATLTMLLLAVAGVTVAQEGVFDAGNPSKSTSEAPDLESASPDGETTTPENTSAKTTGEGTQAEVPAADEAPLVNDEVQKEDGPGRGLGKPGDKDQNHAGAVEQELAGTDEGPGKGLEGPEETGKPENIGKGRSEVGGGAEKAGSFGGGREKVSVCHKGKRTLSVGAPARNAHLRHGDSPGACG